MEVQAFLSALATERRVSASTQNQALAALLFLYREVLGVEQPWLDDVSGPNRGNACPWCFRAMRSSACWTDWKGHIIMACQPVASAAMRGTQTDAAGNG